ncbi:XkdQ/YqbQ family protein [Geoglobus ahangari]
MSYTIAVDGQVIASDSNDLLIFPAELSRKFAEDSDTLRIVLRDDNSSISNSVSVGKQIVAEFTIGGIYRKFSGVIISKKNVYVNNKPALEISCADVSSIFARRFVAESYASQTIEAIVSDLIAKYASDVVNQSFIATTGVALTIDFRYKSLKDCLNRLAELSGCMWFVDENNNLHFDYANNLKTSTSKTVDSVEEYDIQESADIINRVYIYGGLDSNGVRVAVLMEDPNSIATYGAFEKVIFDYEITSQDQAKLIGSTILTENAQPVTSVEATFRDQNVDVGEIVTLNITKENFSRQLLIKQLDETIYHNRIVQRAVFESFRKDAVTILESMDERVAKLEQQQVDLADTFVKLTILSEDLGLKEAMKMYYCDYSSSFILGQARLGKNRLGEGANYWILAREV